MKKFLAIIALAGVFTACNNEGTESTATDSTTTTTVVTDSATAAPAAMDTTTAGTGMGTDTTQHHSGDGHNHTDSIQK